MKTILVLGGNSEIAQATVDELVNRGLRRVILGVRQPSTTNSYLERLRSRGVTGRAIMFDATCTELHTEQIAAVFREERTVDAVIVAFGALPREGLFDSSPAEVTDVLITNYLGVVTASLAVTSEFRKRGHGILIVLSSVAAQRPRKGNLLYASAKAGLDFFARGLHDAVQPGSRVLIVRPGFVQTKMTSHVNPPSTLLVTNPHAVAVDIVRGIARNKSVVWSPSILRWVFLLVRILPRRLWHTASKRMSQPHVQE